MSVQPAWFDRLLTRRSALALAGLMLALNGIIFPRIMRQLAALSGQGMLDVRLFYTPQEALASVAAYPDAARRLYVTSAWTADLLYPLVYASLFALILRWLLRRAFAPTHRLQALAGLPFAAACADLLENAAITALLLDAPAAPVFAVLASIATPLKWALLACSALVAFAGLVGTLAALRRR